MDLDRDPGYAEFGPCEMYNRVCPAYVTRAWRLSGGTIFFPNLCPNCPKMSQLSQPPDFLTSISSTIAPPTSEALS